MTQAITIRTCTPADTATLVSLGIETFRDTFADVNTPENMRLYLSKTFTPEKIAAEFDDPGAVFFIAEDNGAPAGYAKVRASKKPESLNGHGALEVERLYAHQQYIGKGIGKLLMQTCIDHAKQLRYDLIWLGVWEHNQRAIAFYERWGFEKFSQHTFMLGNDAQTDLLLKKKI